METKIRALQESMLLRELELKYNVREVKYDILNYQFEYLQDNVIKVLSLDELVSHLYQDVPKDEVLLKLEMIVDNYIPQYLEQQISKFYQEHSITLPNNLYLFKGLIEFVDQSGDVYYVPFNRSLEQIFMQWKKIIA